MTIYLILDPATETHQTRFSTDGEELEGKTVIELADRVDWSSNRVDWSTLALVEDFSRLDAELHQRIDQAALEFCTGFNPIYAEKERQARALSAGADEADVPLITAEAELRQIGATAMANMIVEAADAARALNNRVEMARIAAKVAVSAAANRADKEAAAAVDWQALR